MKKIIILCLLAGFLPCLAADTQSAHFTGEITQTITYDYLITFPEGYDAKGGEPVPLVLFLHGSGERGRDVQRVKAWGPPRMIEAQERAFPAIVVSPQCPPFERWNAKALSALIDDLVAKHAIDTKRIYVTGLSMGGFGTWGVAAEAPEKIAAIVPICGGGHRDQMVRLKDMPTWVFHGAKDGAVPLSHSTTLVNELNKLGAPVLFTVYPEAGHAEAWQQAYAEDALWDWLFKQSK